MRRLSASLAALCAAACFCRPAVAGEGGVFVNPILPGGYPDPSICRNGDDFYLANSSFEYFPGLPIHHSRDLVNWTLIGHGLHRPEQASGAVNLVDVQSDGGIHAPTLRCHEGRYYLITTNVYTAPAEGAQTQFVNFVLTADDPAGPWSEPHVLEGAPGIDPDLFFDDDGRVWYVGTHSPEKPAFPGEGEIWLQEVDTDEWRLIGERHFLWRGACGGVWAEGPHLYKRDGRYYLLIAEGGTSFNHAVMVAVSDAITGPYESNPRNPILSSRHLSYDHWVNSTGHGDLVELADGRWYMVTLGIRGDLQRRSNMGRETHLVPVVWEREPFWWQEVKTLWPVAAPASGRVERYLPLPFSDSTQRRRNGFADNFDGETLGPEWLFRRVPEAGTVDLAARPGHLRLAALPEVLRERGRAGLVGIRQTESDFAFSASMRFASERDGVEAGIAVVQKDNNYLTFTLRREGDEHTLRAVVSLPEDDARKTREVRELAQRALADYQGTLTLRAVSRDDRYALEYATVAEQDFETLVTTDADHLLSRGYTGAILGLYATGNGGPIGDVADYDWVDYRAYERHAAPTAAR